MYTYISSSFKDVPIRQRQLNRSDEDIYDVAASNSDYIIDGPSTKEVVPA